MTGWPSRCSTWRGDQLWPIVPEMGPDLQRWLSRCDELAARLPLHEADLAAAASELGVGAITTDPFVLAELADTRHDELRWRHGALDRLVRGTRRLLDDTARCAAATCASASPS